jgi:hypothetical protein
MSTTHTAPGESRFGIGGSGASRKSRSQEVEEIVGQRYRYQGTFSDIFRQKYRYHPKIFCLKPYLHGIKQFFWRKENGEWVRKKEKNREKNERERERERNTDRIWGGRRCFFDV